MKLLLGWDLTALIQAVGYFGLFGIVFAESGLLIGFFLPGDSLLFTAGFLASQGYLDIWILVVGCAAAAVAGDNVGYAFGKRVGPKIFTRRESLLFNPRNLEAASRFYREHGGKTLVLARFLPAIRTFAPIVAGAGAMEYRQFFFYNVVGAGLWAVGMPLAGFFLGRVIPGVDRYLLPIVIIIVVLSALPALRHIFRDQGNRQYLASLFKTKILANPLARKAVGVGLVIFGLVALIIPFFPFAWIGFFGLELLGWRVLLREKIRAWRRGRNSST